MQTEEATRRFRKHGNLISIHNHPGEDVPPSVQDLDYAARANFAMMIIVTPHFTYSFTRPEAGWKSQAELAEVVNKYADLFVCRSVGEQEFVGIDPDGAVIMSTDVEVTTTDEALEKICSELGYTLSKVKEVEN